MVCPICGTNCVDAQVCPKCEWDLTEETVDTNIPEPPIGRYEGIDGHIEAWYYTMTIRQKILDKAVEREIAYRDISKIVFVRASNGGNGYMAVGINNSDWEPSNTESNARYDDVALSFEIHNNSTFVKLYDYLKYIVELNENRIKIEASKGKRCPKCKSNCVRKRYMYVPIFVAIGNAYVCNSCGFQWNL